VACDFSTDSEFAEKASRVKDFVWDEVKPLDAPFPGCEYLPITDERRKIVDPINSRSAIAGYGLCTSDLSSAAKGLAP
jgi:acyl-CoA dehydrogenase